MTVVEERHRMTRMAWIARVPLQHVAVFFASTGAFATGVVFGWNSFGGWMLRASVGWKVHEADLVIGIVAAGCCLGCLLCMILLVSCRCRAYVPAYTSVILLLQGWLFIYRADVWDELIMLMLGRGLCGIGVGMFGTLLPVYIGEIASEWRRDRLLYYTHAMFSCGIVVAYALVYPEAENLKDYNFYCALTCLPALLCGLTISINPIESMLTGDENSAKKALLFYDMKMSDERVEREMNKLRELVSKEQSVKFNCNRRFWTLLVITICHHLSGAITVLFNGQTLVDFAGSGDVLTSSQLCLVSSVCQVVASLLGILLIGRLGRRIILTLSATIVGVSMGLLGWTLNTLALGDEVYPWQSPIIIATYYSAYGLGFGPITSAMLSDSFPLRMRVVGASIIGAIGWLVSLLLNLYLGTLLEAFGVATVIWLFVGFSLLGALLGSCLVTETRGKSLLDLQRQFLNG